jgi:hypothetical protein
LSQKNRRKKALQGPGSGTSVHAGWVPRAATTAQAARQATASASLPVVATIVVDWNLTPKVERAPEGGYHNTRGPLQSDEEGRKEPPVSLTLVPTHSWYRNDWQTPAWSIPATQVPSSHLLPARSDENMLENKQKRSRRYVSYRCCVAIKWGSKPRRSVCMVVWFGCTLGLVLLLSKDRAI